MTFRIFTQNVHKRQMQKILLREFPKGFTMFEATGCWKGGTEKALCVEISGKCLARRVWRVAKLIKATNHQEKVLVQRINNTEVVL